MPDASDRAFVVSCEHAGNRIPARYAARFAGHEALLASHRGWDPGAAQLARALARRLGAPLAMTTVSRLLVETNRSEDHVQLFSELSRGLPVPERARIVARWYRPYRERVRGHVAAARAAGRSVVHVSAHSFTPVLDGEVRDVDVGFLFDPARHFESALVAQWVDALARHEPRWRVHRNRPYLGTADGLTTTLRQEHADAHYAGIEIEINQAITTGPPATWRTLRATLARALLDPGVN